LRHGEAECLGGRKVDDEVELGWLLDRDVSRFRPAQNFVDKVGGAPQEVWEIRSIGHQTSRFNVLSKAVYCPQPRSQRQSVDANAVGIQERVGTDVKYIRVGLDERVERRCDVLRPSHFGCSDLKAKLAARCPGFDHIQQNGGNAGIRQDRQSAQTGHNLAQEFDFFPPVSDI
jgi:hypothetical protein